MAVRCPNCDQSNPDANPTCSLCGKALPSHEKTWAGPMPSDEREDTSTAPQAESTESFEHNLHGIVVGGKIAKRYVVKEMLGRGGAAMVFRASDETLGEDIALKVFPNLSHQRGGELDRFKRELLINRRISHVNVIRVHDFGTVGDDAYLTMELLIGGTLADRIEQKPLRIAEAVEIAIGIAEGLHAAHQAGIVHRDVKPENVLFDEAGRPKLTDFGLARLVDSNTMTRGFSGTPFYMSPEQADGAEITTQTDVYSLGVLLFELFTGQLPFFADSLVRIAMLHANEVPPRPSDLRPGLPQSLEQLVLACLSKKPEARPQGAGAVAASLRKFRRDGGLDAARSLDGDPSFTAIKRRARLAQSSDRVDLGAKRREAGTPPDEKPANRETVLVRVNVGEGSSGPRLATQQGSGPRPAAGPPPPPPAVAAPPAREQSLPPVRSREQSLPPVRSREASGARAVVPRPEGGAPRAAAPPPPVEAVAATQRVAELPLPGEGGGAWRRVAVVIAAAGAVAATAVVVKPWILPATPPLASQTQTPRVDSATPVATIAALATQTPRPAASLEPATSVTPRATPSKPATPRPAQSLVVVAPSPTPTKPMAVPTQAPMVVGKGKIVVVSKPWTYLFLDDRPRPLATGRHEIEADAGQHTIRLENPDKRYVSNTLRITVSAGKVCTLQEIDLKKQVDPKIVPGSGCS